MILCDAGPLVAILDRADAGHAKCVAALESLSAPLLTTWPAFTEAMYLLGEAGGWPAQKALWRLILRGTLELSETSPSARARAADLMKRYRDLPMDLADATLVALAEERGLSRIFTLDRDFHVYRLPRGKGFTIIP
jgi:predicted nucleic acid-binding protein